MNCLDCGGFMSTERVGKYEVDLCSKCESVWFDREEAGSYLRRLVVKTNSTAASAPTLEPKRPVSSQETEAGQVVKRSCPRCGTELAPFNFAYDSNVFVAKCPDCQGIWSTKDQLTAIAAHLKRHPADGVIASSVIARTARQEAMGLEAVGPSVSDWISRTEAVTETILDNFMDFGGGD